MAERDKALRARDLRVRLGSKEILRGVSLELEFGQLGVIAGPNGAGKSTLLRSMLGLLPSEAGSVHVEGRSLEELTREERAKRIAYVPQRSVLDAALRVEDVVAQGQFAQSAPRSKARLAVREAMERSGIEGLRGRNYLQLSGGERRLVLIARALCTNARILCLDEPTSSLDIANRLRTLALLRQLAEEGHAVLCVLHELEDVRRFADHVSLLHEGTIASAGAPEDVVVPEEVAAVYSVEMRNRDALGFHLPAEPKA